MFMEPKFIPTKETQAVMLTLSFKINGTPFTYAVKGDNALDALIMFSQIRAYFKAERDSTTGEVEEDIVSNLSLTTRILPEALQQILQQKEAKCAPDMNSKTL